MAMTLTSSVMITLLELWGYLELCIAHGGGSVHV